MAAGTQQLADASPTLANGIATAADGASTLSGGASQVAAGTSKLAAAAPTLSSGASQLASGAASADEGAKSLASGLTKLESGSKELADKLDDGRTKIPSSTASSREDQASVISDPVKVGDDNVASAGNYGAGLAPFFISLAAWIGMYALFLILKPISKRAITAVRKPLRVVLGGWLTPALLGVVQMVALFLIVRFALDLNVVQAGPTIGIMVLASATFAAIIMALNVLLGSVGQFLGLVLMLMQLVTAGGTFPWQTLPGPLAALHFALPMTYSVDAIRQTMYGGSRGGGVVGHRRAALLAPRGAARVVRRDRPADPESHAAGPPAEPHRLTPGRGPLPSHNRRRLAPRHRAVRGAFGCAPTIRTAAPAPPRTRTAAHPHRRTPAPAYRRAHGDAAHHRSGRTHRDGPPPEAHGRRTRPRPARHPPPGPGGRGP